MQQRHIPMRRSKRRSAGRKHVSSKRARFVDFRTRHVGPCRSADNPIGAPAGKTLRELQHGCRIRCIRLSARCGNHSLRPKLMERLIQLAPEPAGAAENQNAAHSQALSK